MDDITDERLREIIENTYCCLDEGPLLAAELLTARAEIERLREDGNTTAMDLVDERDAARADLREAVELIRLTCSGYESPEWKEQAAELLDRHKETP